MFAKRRKESDDYIGPSTGWAKLMHRTVMFVLLPLRKPGWFLLALAVAFLLPTFNGIKPTEVHTWYWNKIKQLSSTVSTVVTDKTKDVIEKIPEIKLPEVQIKETQKVVNVPIKESKRKVFEKAKSQPVAIDIMVEKKEQVINLETSKSEDDKPQETIANKKKLALNYLENPENISGPAKIINANELNVDGKHLFLYGIYVDPVSPRGVEAKKFLQQTISNNQVTCEIIAYTYQSIPTGLCKVKDININWLLVDNGYSKNVALEKR